jgi:SET domain-containing protein
MLLVKTKIGPSDIHGIGLFADQDIPKDTPVWEFREGFDLVFANDSLNEISPEAKRQMIWYSYKDPEMGFCIVCSDDARFCNCPRKGENPNTIPAYWGRDIAARDIKKGEEITAEYESWEEL